MALGLIASVVDAITRGPEGGVPASLTMAGVSPLDPSRIYKNSWHNSGTMDFSERALQWWPETLSDTIDITWDFKNVGGGSHALAQWSSNGGRTLAFDVQLSRLMMPVASRNTGREGVIATLTSPEDQRPADNRPYNVDIVEQIRFLRAFCYPTYIETEGIVGALPPPVMILSVPNFGLNESGGDEIFCVMTGCDVTYTLAFRDGTPRRANVSVTLRQIVQNDKGIQFKGFGPGAPATYEMIGPGESLNVNAGRTVNGIDPTRVK